MPYRAISSYFSPGAAATRRPPAGRPARPAAGTLPPPAPGPGPRRLRPAWGGGPRPGPVKPPLRGCAGRTRPQASWRAREGGLPAREPRGSGLPRRPRLSGPRPPLRRGTRGPGPAWPRAREREAPESAPGRGPGGGRAARDLEPPLLARPPGPLPGSGPRRAREPLSPGGEGGGSRGGLRGFPPAGAAWAGGPGGRGDAGTWRAAHLLAS